MTAHDTTILVTAENIESLRQIYQDPIRTETGWEYRPRQMRVGDQLPVRDDHANG